MSLQRRTFFAILGGCAVSAEELLALHEHHAAEVASGFEGYRPRALSPAEYGLLDQVAETLLPADQTGPGAHDAHVSYYIDVVLNYGNPAALQSWKTGLAHVNELASQRFERTFAECSEAERQQILLTLAASEMAPETEMDRFFVELKRTVIEAFYASDLIQREHLGYKGNTAIAEFAGCTHPNFEHPDLA